MGARPAATGSERLGGTSPPAYTEGVTVFDLRSLHLRSGQHVERRLEVELEPFDLGGARYVCDPPAPTATVSFTRATSGIVFRQRLATTLRGPCQRCLEDAAVPLAIDATEYEDARPGTDEDLRTQYLVDQRLDLSAWARDAIALALPAQILCADDCAGLCAQCGANLNEGPCGCALPPPDPRLAKLAALKDLLR
jgi:uncharacterized protein